MKTLVKVLIILGMIIGGISIIPIIVGIIAINKINNAKSKSDLTLIGILTLLLCNPLAGILMFFIEFDQSQKPQNELIEENINKISAVESNEKKVSKYSGIDMDIVETITYLVLIISNIVGVIHFNYGLVTIILPIISLIITTTLSSLEKRKITKYFAIANFSISLNYLIIILYFFIF